MRIGFLGDSLTWGGYGGNWVQLVARALPNHDIHNFGVGGDTVINLQRRLPDILSQHQPDALFIMVGGNDAVSYSMPATRRYYQFSKGILPDGIVTPEDHARVYRDLLTEVQLHHVQALVGLSPTEYSRHLVEVRQQYTSQVRELVQRLNIPMLDLDTAFTPVHPIEREAVSLKFIQDIGARVASGWQDFEAERARYGYSYTFDGMHLLPATAQRFAELIVPFLRENLAL